MRNQKTKLKQSLTLLLMVVVLLTNSIGSLSPATAQTPEPTPEVTATAEPAPTEAAPTETAVPEIPTPVVIVVTETPTDTPAPEETALPTEENTPVTPTETPIAASETPGVPTETPAVASETPAQQTEAPTPTETPAPTRSTPTPEPTSLLPTGIIKTPALKTATPKIVIIEPTPVDAEATATPAPLTGKPDSIKEKISLLAITDFTYEVIDASAMTIRITGYKAADTTLDIPASIDGYTVTEIADHALQGKRLTAVTLPPTLTRIGNYAFADNDLLTIAFPAGLVSIGDYAFRDNELTAVTIPAAVQTIGSAAFISNFIANLTIQEDPTSGSSLQTIGNSAFEQNNLVEVALPTSITSMGTDVFALNGRYVKVMTSNPLIKTEYSAKGYGHVVNPVTIIVKSVDKDGNTLLSDQVIGDDLTIPGEAFTIGQEVTYTPQTITGYYAAPVTFTPDKDGYILTVVHTPTTVPPTITKADFIVLPNATAAEVEALIVSGLSAVDMLGTDITSSVTWTHAIDTAVAGTYQVTYTVTDRWGNETVKLVTATVTTDWGKVTVCNDWLHEDFTYSTTGETVIGLSASGYARYQAGNTNLCVPGINPKTMQPITTIGVHAFSRYATTNSLNFSTVNFSKSTQLTSIGLSAFENSASLTQIDFSPLTNLTTIGQRAFINASFSKLDFSNNPKLQVIDHNAFYKSNVTDLNLTQNAQLSKIGDYSFYSSTFTTSGLNLKGNPELAYIGANAFYTAKLTTLDLTNNSKLVMIGNAAFNNALLGSLDLSNCTSLSHIGNSAFFNSPLTNLQFAENSPLTYIGDDAFRNAILSTLDATTLVNIEYFGPRSFYLSPIQGLDLSQCVNLKVIGTNAFYTAPLQESFDLSNLKKLEIIGTGAFYKAYSLKNLDLSGLTNLRYIGVQAFIGAKLTNLNLAGDTSLTTIDISAFGLSELTSLDLSSLTSLVAINNGAFSNSPLTSLALPPSLTDISNSAFLKSNLETLDLSVCPNLTFIGNQAFQFSPLKTLILDNPKLFHIGSSVFSGAELTTLDLTKLPGLRFIGPSAFAKSQISTLNFSNNPVLEVIGSSAFSAAGLTSLDLSYNPKLAFLGMKAFENSTLSEVWISPTANIYLQQSGNMENSYLYKGLIDGDKVIFRTKDPANTIMVSNPTGAGTAPYATTGSGTIDFSFKSSPYNLRFLDNSQLPWSKGTTGVYTHLYKIYREYKYLDTTVSIAPYLVNPTIVTVHSKDINTGAELILPYTLTPTSGTTYTVYPQPIFGYHSPQPQTIDLDGPYKTVEFLYTPMTPEELGNTTMYHLEQHYATETPPPPYLIGTEMLSYVRLDMSGFNTNLESGKIVLHYDPAVYDDKSIRVDFAGTTVTSWTASNGVLTLNVGPTPGGTDFDIPIIWKFKPYVTPEYTPYPITASLFRNNSDGTVTALAKAEDITFSGYYRDPYMIKLQSNQSVDGVVLRNFSESPYGDKAIGDVATEYVDFTYSVRDLDRNVAGFVVTDTLPTYYALINGVLDAEPRPAVFVAADNPGWSLSADGKTVTYTGNANGTRSIIVPRLRLRFPYAKYYNNITNAVSITMTPHNTTPYENDMVVSDKITFLFGERPASMGIMDKHIMKPHYDGDKAYFYDTAAERRLEYPWDVYFNFSSGDMTNVVITDYNMDERLYYSGVVVPSAFIGATLNLIDENGVTFKSVQITSTTTVLTQQEGTAAVKVQITSPKIVKGNYVITFLSKLIDPVPFRYDPTPESNLNVFLNSASLSAVNSSGMQVNIIDVDEPLYIVAPIQAVSPIKNQVINNDPNSSTAFAGQPVRYDLIISDATVETLRDELHDFVMIDLLPVGLSVTKVTLSADFNASLGSYQIIDNYNNTGQTAIIFTAPAVKTISNRYFNVATIETVINMDVPDGTLKNHVYMDFSDTNIRNINEAPVAVIDPTETQTYSHYETALTVARPKAMIAFKSIKASDSTAWSSTGILTESNEHFEYRLTIINNTQVDRSNMVIVDVLPYIGDTAIQSNLAGERIPRESEFANFYDTSTLVSVNLPGYTVYYYNSDTPISYGSSTTEDVLDNQLTWSSAPAYNTKAIRVVQNDGVILAQGQTLEIIIPMIAPDNTDMSLSGMAAYNTYVRKDNTTLNRYLEPNRVFNMVPYPSGMIQLVKVDGSNNLLAGAKFELRNLAGELITTATSGVDGLVLFTNIPYGDYTVKEITPPAGYQPVATVWNITLNMMQTAVNGVVDLGMVTNIPVPPPPIYGKVVIEKVDINGIALGGIQFTITGTGANNSTVKMVGHTDANGRLTFSNLPAGPYTITETRPVGNLDPVAAFNTEITYQGQVVYFVTDSNNPEALGAIVNNKAKVRVTKLGLNQDKSHLGLLDLTSADGVLLSGIKFMIVETGVELTTNAQGYVEFTGLDVNTVYHLRETSSNPYFQPYAGDIPFMVNERGQLLLVNSDGGTTPFPQGQIYVPNLRKELQGHITIYKKDGEGNNLAGAVFTLYKQDANGVYQPVGTMTTQPDGTAVSPLLGPGVYRVVETFAPTGYASTFVVRTFTINQYPEANGPLEVPFTWDVVDPKLDLSLIKYEMIVKNISYADAVTMLEAMGPGYKIVTSDFKDAPATTSPGTLVHIVKPLNMVGFGLYLDGVQVTTGSTAADGLLHFNTPVDETKTYMLRELNTPEGYRPLIGDIPVRIKDYTTRPGFDGKIIVPVENKKLLGQISLSKYNLTTKQALEGVTFKLVTPEGKEYLGVTNELGYITWQNLPFGIYALIEVETLMGYELDETIRVVEITPDNPHNYVVVYNKEAIRDLRVRKIDRRTGVGLAGATFILQDANGNTMTRISDAEGWVEFLDIAFSTYTLKEIKAPDGYRLNQKVITIVVNKDTEDVITYGFEDSLIDEALPDTGTSGALAFLAAGVGLVLASLAIRRKRTA